MSATEPATVTVTIDGKTYTLRPALPTMRTIGRALNGYVPMLRALSDVNPDAMVLVVVAGTASVGKAAARIEDAIYAHGLEDLIAPLVRFVGICMAGERDPAAAKPVSETEEMPLDAIGERGPDQGGTGSGSASADRATAT